MFIEEIVVDGFKSYAARTVIGPWDNEFNAITGLNGSGKSNILDAICFVLGISNLSQVRAQNLQDLVYKRGQAGITKASVSIVFNNDNNSQSPVGFEHCEKITVTRQIVIGGKNKYMINGHLAQHQAIANLFQSVQLNINNPHFLIMQGRITKVLNMKPPEILAMIEEAAGTRMFEEKKDKALKTISKKDSKLTEITDLMENDIAPKLDKLKKEKADFLTFQKIEGELERLRRFVVAYDFMKSKEKLSRTEEDLEEKRGIDAELKRRSVQLEQEIQRITEDLQQILRQKEQELKRGGQFQQLQQEVNELANILTRVHTQCQLKTTAINEERASLRELEAVHEKLQVIVTAAQEETLRKDSQYESVKTQFQEQSDQVKKLEAFLQTVSTGIAGSEGHDNGYAEQIEAAKLKKSQALTETEQAKQRIVYLNNQLKQKNARAKEAEKENAGNLRAYRKIEATIAELKVKKESLAYDANLETALLKQKKTQEVEARRLQEQMDQLKVQLASVDFRYSDPYPGFDRRKVKGLVAKLIKIDGSRMNYATALQICAEGRLYFVVVEDNKVGSDLLKNGKLKRKYTIIPLKQIVAPEIAPSRIVTAQQLAPGRVEHALSLVGYEDEVEAAMKFTFGSTLICKDAESAKVAAYHPDVKLRCITLDGDVYEPGATITGGSSPQSSDLLVRLSKLNELETSAQELHESITRVDAELAKARMLKEQVERIESEEKKLQYEATALKNVMDESTAGQLLQEVENYTRELVSLEDTILSAQSACKDADEQIKTLEMEMKDFSSNRDGKIRKIEKDVSKAKADLAKQNLACKNLQRQLLSARQEQEQQEAELSDIVSQIKAATQNLQTLVAEENELKKQETDIKARYADMDLELQKQNRLYVKFDKDLTRLEETRKSHTECLNEMQIESKRLHHEMERLVREKEVSLGAVQSILLEHDWIVDQQDTLGVTFDFANQNPSDCRKRLRQLEQEHETLRKKINVKVMNMIDRVVTKERSLKQMLATVKKDKGKIEETIDQLDQYKKEALQKTWEQVNGDFGSIFDELLPGNTAKLEPPEGQSLTEGLEVKVCLGGVWKQSLTELSGGQRSLVALSLILSLLQFKPAPMYILDEIDAALDLSHTQNIGHLFKTRFKGSQFIVVSLKEGMFNNASVLFKARFRDGTSVVERFCQGDSSGAKKALRMNGKENEAEMSEQGSKSKTKKAPSAASKRARRVDPAM